MKLHSSSEWPCSTTTGANSSARASGPWITERTSTDGLYAPPPDAAIRLTSSSRRSWRAFAAACEIRPSGFSGSSAELLLLKNANVRSDCAASSRSGSTHSASSSSL